MYRLKAKDLMATELITLDKSETLDLADEIMRLARVRHLPVLEDGHLAGLVTHRDILRAQVSALAGLSRDQSRQLEAKIPVAEIMTSGVRSVSPDTPAVEVARIMRDHKFGCVPVVDGGRLVGIITEADFLDLVLRALDDADPRSARAPALGEATPASGCIERPTRLGLRPGTQAPRRPSLSRRGRSAIEAPRPRGLGRRAGLSTRAGPPSHETDRPAAASARPQPPRDTRPRPAASRPRDHGLRFRAR